MQSGYRVVAALVLVMAVARCLIAEDRPSAALWYQKAQKLQQEGKTAEAFEAYLAVPGGEHAAAELARTRGREFLQTANRLAGEPHCQASVYLIQGDLLLASGDREGALAAYRQYASRISRQPGQPASAAGGYYAVEPPARPPSQLDRGMVSYYEPAFPASPFEWGPGSFRDNWLIRRFIALDDWDDAAREFGRIWPMYLSAAGDKSLPARGMEFALDYALFLQRQKEIDKAADVLRTVLLRLDMDQLPEATTPGGDYREYGGVYDSFSRVEFIQGAYAFFKATGRENQLVQTLQQQIDSGHNPMRRVLAQVRLCQGNAAEALACELAYIDAGNFDALSTAMRRGLIFEKFNKLPEAAEEFGKAVALPYTPANLPGTDEAQEASLRGLQVLPAAPQGDEAAEMMMRAEVCQRLLRIETAQGRTDAALDVSLLLLDTQTHDMWQPEDIEDALNRFKAAGELPRLAAWLKAHAGTARDVKFRIAAYWAVGDVDAAIATIAESVVAEARKGNHQHDLVLDWEEKFKSADPRAAVALLAAVIKADPLDAKSRMWWLDLNPNVTEAEAVSTLEIILAPDAEEAIPVGMRVYNPSRFKDYFALGSRLMHLYEKTGRTGKMQSLALRIAREARPFARKNRNELDGASMAAGNAALAVAIEHAEPKKELPALADALEKSPWREALAQVKRRMAAQPADANKTQFPWANVPAGVHLLAGCGNVLCLCRDDRRVYAGYPWGIAVYDFDGRGARRIPLATAALDLAVGDHWLWAATPDGLFQISLDDYSVRRLADRVTLLGARGDTVWMKSDGELRELNGRTLEMRTLEGEGARVNNIGAGGLHVQTPEGVALPNRAPQPHLHLSDVFNANWATLGLPNDTIAVAGRSDTTRYQYGREEDPMKLHAPDIADDAGGLYFVKVAGSGGGMDATHEISAIQRVSAQPYGDVIRGDTVFFAAADGASPQSVWIGGDGALTLLAPSGQVAARYSRGDGLPVNKMLSGAALDGKMYFAAGWDGSTGGLVVFDPDTRVFTSLTTADGLAGDQLVSISADDNALKIHYGAQRILSRNGFEYVTYSSGAYTPAAGFTEPGSPQKISEEEAEHRVDLVGPPPVSLAVCPWLGGLIISQARIGGRTFIRGTRGLVILDDPSIVPEETEELKIHRTPGPAAAMLQQVRDAKIPNPISVEDLNKFCGSANPFMVAEALAGAYEPVKRGELEYLPLILPRVHDANPRIRATAVLLLCKCPDESAADALTEALKDSDPYIRAVAALSLERRGRKVLVELFEPMLREPYGFGNYPFGAGTSMGIQADAELAYAAMSLRADRKTFELLVKYPPSLNGSSNQEIALPLLGEALLAHPDAAEPLLRATHALPALADGHGRGDALEFSRQVFAAAGVKMLPILHDALASPDRVVRSNAARACGQIGDPSSIEPLIKSLDLQSGLSRASIVWALGRLKAARALPELYRLYAGAKEKEGWQDSDRAPREIGAAARQFEAGRNGVPGAAVWDEIKAAAPTAKMEAGVSADESADGPVLQSGDVLQAIREIGAGQSQDFYRPLVASAAAEVRAEAARGLGECAAAEAEKNLPLLRGLLGDQDDAVRLAAAISLAMLDDADGRKAVVAGLATGNPNEQMRTLAELQRITIPGKLAFAIEALNACAYDMKLDEGERELAKKLLAGE